MWRKTVKGHRGATPRPGSMTVFIQERGLLPAEEIDLIKSAAVPALLRFQEMEAGVPLHERADLSQWMRLFDLRDSGIFGDLYAAVGRRVDRIDL
jgi:hypothetical protein